jgi:hypothetical protein
MPPLSPRKLTKGAFEGLNRDEVVARLRASLAELSLEERFTLLHELGIYHGNESLSGEASSLGETRALRDALPSLFHRHRVRAILDVPCGDFNWMSTIDLGGANYVGGDIVRELVARNNALFKSVGRAFRFSTRRDDRPAPHRRPRDLPRPSHPFEPSRRLPRAGKHRRLALTVAACKSLFCAEREPGYRLGGLSPGKPVFATVPLPPAGRDCLRGQHSCPRRFLRLCDGSLAHR